MPNSRVPFCLGFLLKLFHSSSCIFTKDTCICTTSSFIQSHQCSHHFLRKESYLPPRLLPFKLPFPLYLCKFSSNPPVLFSMCSTFQTPATSVVFSTFEKINTVDKQWMATRKLSLYYISLLRTTCTQEVLLCIRFSTFNTYNQKSQLIFQTPVTYW